jgi:hypothetical protein
MLTVEGTRPSEGSGAERKADEVVLRIPTMGRLMRALLPDEAVEHLYNAQREQLLAVRSILDAALDRLDEAQRQGQPPTIQRHDIRVE